MLAKRAFDGYQARQAARGSPDAALCEAFAAAGVSGGWLFFAHPV
jgi:hypothetical protein